MVLGGVELGASVWDRSSLCLGNSTMASGRRIGWSSAEGCRGGEIGDMFEGELTGDAGRVEAECEGKRKIQDDSQVS